jgi:hypothetical protein
MSRIAGMLLLVLISTRIAAQSPAESRCGASVFVVPAFTGSIEFFATPNGAALTPLRNDIANEDYLYLEIVGQTDSLYLVDANLSIAGKVERGWIRKSTPVLRIYTDTRRPVRIRVAASARAEAVVTIPPPDTAMHRVRDCRGGWLLIDVDRGGKRLQGWIAPRQQCSDAYNGCTTH